MRGVRGKRQHSCTNTLTFPSVDTAGGSTRWRPNRTLLRPASGSYRKLRVTGRAATSVSSDWCACRADGCSPGLSVDGARKDNIQPLDAGVLGEVGGVRTDARRPECRCVCGLSVGRASSAPSRPPTSYVGTAGDNTRRRTCTDTTGGGTHAPATTAGRAGCVQTHATVGVPHKTEGGARKAASAVGTVSSRGCAATAPAAPPVGRIGATAHPEGGGGAAKAPAATRVADVAAGKRAGGGARRGQLARRGGWGSCPTAPAGAAAPPRQLAGRPPLRLAQRGSHPPPRDGQVPCPGTASRAAVARGVRPRDSLRAPSRRPPQVWGNEAKFSIYSTDRII